MFVSLANFGSVVLDVSGNRLDASFLRETGAINDTFTLVKGTATGNVPPTAIMTSPQDGSTLASPPSVLLMSSASDTPPGTVTSVSYYDGPTLIGSSVISPYPVTWVTPSVGNHRLTARASDNNGQVGISAPVFVTITP